MEHYEFDYASARQRANDRATEDARAALPAWFLSWAGDHIDAEGPPATLSAGEIRARLDSFGFARYAPTPTARGRGLLRRIHRAIQSIARAVRANHKEEQ